MEITSVKEIYLTQVASHYHFWGLMVKKGFLPKWIFQGEPGESALQLYDRLKPYIDKRRVDKKSYAENYSWNLSFNPDTKQLTIANYMFISSSRMYTAVFQANNPYYVLSGTGDDTVTTYNAGLSPKIIDGHFCIPASSLAKLPNVENMRFDANSKTVNFTFNLDW